MLIFSAAKVIKKLETTKDFELKNVNYGNFSILQPLGYTLSYLFGEEGTFRLLAFLS